MKALLALETSSAVLSLAVQNPEGRIYSKSFKGPHRHAEKIIPAMEALFKKSGLSLKKTNTFLTGQGPGSFTGLRIGFGTLKGLLAAKKSFCYGALSLDLIAEHSFFKKMPEGCSLAVALDAFRQKIYLRIYKKGKADWTAQGEVQTLGLHETLAALPENCIVTGNALDKYSADFKKEEAAKKITLAAEKFWYPQAAALIGFFNRADSRLKKISSRELLPLYFRLSEAEERAASK